MILGHKIKGGIKLVGDYDHLLPKIWGQAAEDIRAVYCDKGRRPRLGLDISYRIVVRRHHGNIRVTSQPGDTRFTVLSPLEQRRPPKWPCGQ